MPVSKDQYWASIVCEGETLTEYKDGPDIKSSGEHLERYIESEPGKEYEIHYGSSLVQGAAHDSLIYVHVDGTLVTRVIFRKGRAGGRTIEGFESPDRINVAPFQFTTMAICESDDPEIMSKDTFEDLGTIKLSFHESDFGKQSFGPKLRVPEDIKSSTSEKIDEESKKNKSEGTSYGNVRRCRDVPLPRSSITRKEKTPFLTITFRYLSGVILEIKGIKPIEIPTLKQKGEAFGKRKNIEVIVISDDESGKDVVNEYGRKKKKKRCKIKPE